MKKLFLVMMMSIGLLFATNIESNAQMSLGVNAGYSWLSGVVGGEFNSGHWGVGVGYMPTSMPYTGDPITSIGWYVTYQDAVYQESSGYYISFGSASQGYRYEQYSSSGYRDRFTAPMWIGMIGYKYNWYSGLNMKAGGGYGWCEYSGVFTWELTLGYQFGI